MITLDLAKASFLIDCEVRNLSDKTAAYYAKTISPFLVYIQDEHGITQVEDVLSEHVKNFLLGIHKKWSAGTVHAYGRGLRVFFNYCVREEWIESSPMRKVRMPKKDTVILPAFTESEFRNILSCCTNLRDKAICLFMADTGVRVGEMAAIRGKDMDMQTGSVIIRQPKNRKERIVHFGNATRKSLVRYFAQVGSIPTNGDVVWQSSDPASDHLTAYGIQMLMKRLKAASGIKHCHAHTFRRTFAIWSLRNGMNIYMLQKLMGHSDLTVLRRYLEIVEADAQEAHRNFGAIDHTLYG